jgi:FdhE protein
MNIMTRDVWLVKHPYLQPLADLHAAVEAAAEAMTIPSVRVPAWDDYAEDFHAGVSLLHSSTAAIDVSGLSEVVSSLAEALASSTLTVSPGDPGLVCCLESTVLARYLEPVVRAFATWRNEERWLRNYCPTCGSPPAMAQLVGIDPGRLRLLSCGVCRTRWRYARTGCPFCDTASHRLAIIAVEGEAGLRIDYCDSCRAYLKTYDGEGDASFFLSDWTSLHLDAVAQDRGLRRLAASLYELQPASDGPLLS